MPRALRARLPCDRGCKIARELTMLHLQLRAKGGIARCGLWERPSRFLLRRAQRIAEYLVLGDREGQLFQFLAKKEQQNVAEDPGQRYRVRNCVVDRQQQRAAGPIATYALPGL